MERSILLKSRRCACGNMRRATRAITQYYDSCLKPSGLRATQLSLMLGISLNESPTIGELAELMVMDQTTVTRNVESLQKTGFIEVVSEESDARKKRLTVTTKGLEKLSEAMPLWELAQTRMENGLGNERLRELLKILSEVTALAK